ncbi:YrhK family protein [Curtobacterium flaccumfaciens]|jgi:YrhK-like protein|uniref:YrhK family protein n=1 Tax=Curtobacterium flaccumfaciens TaxID=2035 RepID=UPI001BDE6387|nr:YrhK family protein [Curtobacterium flaccumfaciens]MBT1583188.1 YrhK family protein [Curtobacterium flaccumfaciens pv. flaccumfaciens]MBT1606227.1 YrhK family protein [Curtobacterium flaccumfaciens pv. betae]MBT1656889.1 YrhK family protein [Curtobacterium flaccumfaciens pv. betae]MCS0472656.1 YrhK family protein [Curtobacterium flaccumfaciens pv. betae]MCS0476220.1 YrhK family protein [Curtobacterium flaccumfaciens pv. betae]
MAQDERDIALRVGHEELRIRGVYETISIINDVMVALWFIVGSVLFFSESTTTAGTWLFLIGSIQLLIRPVIRLSRRLHLGRVGRGNPTESARDF